MTQLESLSSLAFASNLIRFPNLHTQMLEDIEKRKANGVFVGFMHCMPYFLNFDYLINPHVFICGVTGSGKTYLMRSLFVKLSVILDSLVLLLDFTGEYREFVEMIGEKEIKPEHAKELLGTKNSGIIYVNLKDYGDENAKVGIAETVMDSALHNMRSGKEKEKRTFLFLDEAWKLLGSSNSLHTILREGRKYKYGLVFSSQLVEDMDLAMLSNAATIFLFRLQNRQGLEKLGKNYNLRTKHMELIQKLGVGSCAVIQNNSSGRRDFLIIEKVHGVETEEFEKFMLGGKMQLEIPRSMFESVMSGLCSAAVFQRIRTLKARRGYYELSELVKMLIDSDLEPRRILGALRQLRIGEDAIADAFAEAVSVLDVEHETRVC